MALELRSSDGIPFSAGQWQPCSDCSQRQLPASGCCKGMIDCGCSDLQRLQCSGPSRKRRGGAHFPADWPEDELDIEGILRVLDEGLRQRPSSVLQLSYSAPIEDSPKFALSSNRSGVERLTPMPYCMSSLTNCAPFISAMGVLSGWAASFTAP